MLLQVMACTPNPSKIPYSRQAIDGLWTKLWLFDVNLNTGNICILGVKLSEFTLFDRI